MVDAPKRSLGETISQLVVIAILIAILIGALIFLRQYIESHNTSSSPATSLQIRTDARMSYYNLATTMSQKDMSTTGPSVFETGRVS